jgi:hypothetical protein
MKRRRWWLAGAAGVAAAISLLMVPALGDGPITSEVGVLRLHLDSDGDKLIFDPTAAGSNQTQTLTAPGCKLTSTGVSLVGFAASATQTNKSPFPGLKDHRIGVGQNGEGNGEPCARINRDLGQTLTLSLTGALQGQVVGYAEIDLGFKFDGDAILQLFRSGAQVGPDIMVPCSGASDCGPDSGGADNERVILWLDPADNPPPGHWQEFQINGVFDTIVIKPGTAAPSGVVSLEGGFNGSPAGPVGGLLGTDDTLFRVVDAFDGEIDCGGDPTVLGGGNATFSVIRGFDTEVLATDPDKCKGPDDGLLFEFDSGTEDGELFIDFVTEPVDENPATVFAQFLEVITWTFTGPPDVQHLTLDYDDHVGAGRREMPWCEMDPRVGGGLPQPPVNPTDYLPDGHTSCLIDVHSYVSPEGTFTTVHTIYNIGDGKRWN